MRLVEGINDSANVARENQASRMVVIAVTPVRKELPAEIAICLLEAQIWH
jgi:hypothetical protein